MHGENGFPETPDWTPTPGFTCAACTASANLCHVLRSVDEQPCCPQCTHLGTAGVKREPMVWQGDNA